MLLQAYANGVFPMSNSASDPDIFWVEPKYRGIFPLDGFHLSRSAKRAMRQHPPIVKVNNNFNEIVSACANRSETWINAPIKSLYNQLHQSGFAHSIAVYDQQGKLFGGVYGLSLIHI